MGREFINTNITSIERWMPDRLCIADISWLLNAEAPLQFSRLERIKFF
jgi:hypothetical protein